jgi:predicted nucleic acid-binding protein
LIPSVVVDTDVVSYFFKNDSRAEAYRPHLDGNLLIISFMTVAELDVWALQSRWGTQRRSRLEEHLERYAIYHASRQLCRGWAEVTAGARRKGRPIDCADAWIAATALILSVPLVTHNVRHYAQVDGLELITEAIR